MFGRESGYLLLEGVEIGEGGTRLLGLVVSWLAVVCLWVQTCLVKNEISERQLLSFIERSERL